MNWFSGWFERRDEAKRKAVAVTEQIKEREADVRWRVHELSTDEAESAWRQVHSDEELVHIDEASSPWGYPGVGPALVRLLESSECVGVEAMQVCRSFPAVKTAFEDLLLVGSDDDGEEQWFQVVGEDTILVGKTGATQRPGRIAYASVFHALLSDYLFYSDEDLDQFFARLREGTPGES